MVGLEKVNIVAIVGDAMAIPLADELAARPDAYDTSTLFAIASGGALLSPVAKQRLQDLLPGKMILDGFGSSETGVVGTGGNVSKDDGGPPRFQLNDQTAVLDDDLEPVTPGSGAVGQLARRRRVPIGYYKDPDKSAATFVTLRGERWALLGDMATVETDGTIRLLGRGSVSINTGGEKVYPEEVEAAVKEHPAVFDCVVVGLPDERWGERVVAVVKTRTGAPLSLEEVRATCRKRIAAYKLPRDVITVEEVVRSPAGKADYRWAREAAGRAAEKEGS